MVLRSRTAMAEDSKVRSLTNEIIRRMLTTSKSTAQEERNRMLDDIYGPEDGQQWLWLETN